MGQSNITNRQPMEWQRDFAGMLKHGTRVRQFCLNRPGGIGCEYWRDVDLAPFVEAEGLGGTLWNRDDPCPKCGGKAIYSAAPARGTPLRPLRG